MGLQPPPIPAGGLLLLGREPQRRWRAQLSILEEDLVDDEVAVLEVVRTEVEHLKL